MDFYHERQSCGKRKRSAEEINGIHVALGDSFGGHAGHRICHDQVYDYPSVGK
jgi:hypothetical protein